MCIGLRLIIFRGLRSYTHLKQLLIRSTYRAVRAEWNVQMACTNVTAAIQKAKVIQMLNRSSLCTENLPIRNGAPKAFRRASIWRRLSHVQDICKTVRVDTMLERSSTARPSHCWPTAANRRTHSAYGKTCEPALHYLHYITFVQGCRERKVYFIRVPLESGEMNRSLNTTREI